MDTGTLLGSPTRDPDWLRKCAIIGLLMLIPVAGWFNLGGWMKAAYARLKAGETTLPEPTLEYIGSGWSYFLAVLPPFLILLAWNIVVAIVRALGFDVIAGFGSVFGALLQLGIQFLVVPILTYRHLAQDTGFADAFDLEALPRVVTDNRSAFVSYALVMFLASIIGSLGLAACCIGIVITAPYSSAITAAAVRAFEQTRNG